MKKISIAFFAGAVMLASSCTKKLDINDNPNQSTSATPQVMLPQAVAATASVLNAYNSYGAQVGGYMANAGGYGGFGSNVTYNWSSSDYSGLWANTYDNLNDYQVTINLAEAGGSELGYFNAAARIMKAIGFQLLVDTYNDVPYTDALQGVTNLTPSYNTGTDIYKMLGEELDKAIALINETAANG
ncbi:MAG TPA: SusD/RagB family nutrient-binding outer membrane lipoprotein, partial [Flavihumibacter sp.]|nr:SusD/RagB family nutrient-binding outer membrane lipoprotein [Flavihumibacter sp.]